MGVTKRVVVTGANKGVGFATVAEILEREADSFVFLGSRSVERGEKARQALVDERPQWAGRVEVLPIDVSDDASVQAAAQTVAGRFESEEKPLYGVVNNAGIGDRTHDMATVLNVNTRGPRRVAKAFLPLIARDMGDTKGRIVNIASASGPNFVAKCSEARQQVLTAPNVTWEQIEAVMDEAVALAKEGGDFEAAGLGNGSAYGLSKACLNAYTIALARQNPDLIVNACTPGFIETDMTRPMAKRQGVSPQEMGMKPPREGTKAALFLLFGNPEGSGWYFGSDAKRSPMDRYRSPGDPPYRGE